MNQSSFVFGDVSTLDDVEPPTMTAVEANLHFTCVERQQSRYGLGMFDDDDTSPRPPYYQFSITLPLPSGERTFTISGDHSKNYTDGVDVLNVVLKGWHPTCVFEEVKDWVKANARALEHARRWYLVKQQEQLITEIENDIALFQKKLEHLNRIRAVSIAQVKSSRWFDQDEKRRMLLDLGASPEELR